MRALLIGESAADLTPFRRGLVERAWWVIAARPADVVDDTRWAAPYDLVLVSVDQVDAGLHTLLTSLREDSPEVVIMVLGEFSVEERIRALGFGADDFLGRETSVALLLGRVMALLRLRVERFRSSYLFDDLSIDLLHRQVVRCGHEIVLSQREYQLLVLLARHAGRTLSRSDIIEQLWGRSRGADDNALDAHVSRLRRKLDKPFGRKLIRTVRGVGFRLVVS